MKHLQLDLMKKPAGTTLATTGNSASISGYLIDRATADVMRQCERGICWKPDGGPAQSQRLPSTNERAALERRLDELAAMRRPAYLDRETESLVSAAVAKMIARFGSVRPEDRAGIVALLSIDLSKLPAWAVDIACDKISRGDMPKISKTFAPSSPEVFSLAKAELNQVQDEEARIKAVLALQPKVENPITAEERQRIGDGLKELANRLRASTQADLGGETHDQWLARHGVTREQFDAVPDAPRKAG